MGGANNKERSMFVLSVFDVQSEMLMFTEAVKRSRYEQMS